jgi:hypothetical protein
LFYINSNDRFTGDHQDFTVNLEFDNTNDFDRVVVMQLLIPISYWLFRTGLNTFQLKEGATTVTVTIPVGNYNRSSLATVASIQLSSASPNGWIYTLSFPNSVKTSDQGFYIYTVSENTSQPSLIFTDNTCLEALGFNQNSTNVFSTNSLTSTAVINLKPENALFLHSDICSNQNDDILQEVYTNGATFSSIAFQQFDVEGNSKEIAFNQNNNYRFYLTDENNRTIDLNGQNMIISILMYKQNPIYSMISQFIKYVISKE